MRVHVADHPLITHKLTALRDRTTPSPVFRSLADELVTLLAYEATRDVRVETITVQTPVAPAEGLTLSDPKPLVVPILRAGLGMLDGLMRLMPSAEVGFLGMVRNEETLQPDIYAERLPTDLSNRQCFVVDPMLATGGSLIAAIEYLFDRGAVDVTCICLIAAPEGLKAVEEATAGREVTIVLGALDERLDEVGYIIRRPRRRRRSSVRHRRALTRASALRRPLPSGGAGATVRPRTIPARPARFRPRLLTRAHGSVQALPMTLNAHVLTSSEASGVAGMMMPGRVAMCCRMSA